MTISLLLKYIFFVFLAFYLSLYANVLLLFGIIPDLFSDNSIALILCGSLIISLMISIFFMPALFIIFYLMAWMSNNNKSKFYTSFVLMELYNCFLIFINKDIYDYNKLIYLLLLSIFFSALFSSILYYFINKFIRKDQ